MAATSADLQPDQQEANVRLRRLFRMFLDVWSIQDPDPSRLRFVSPPGCYLPNNSIIIGAVPTLVAGHDDIFVLENGWRAFNGQRPQLDFSSSFGPLMFLITAVGFKISHASPNGIGYGSAVFGLLIGLWGFRLGRGRLSPVARVLFPLYLVVLICAPYALGTWPLLNSHAMLYNRYGYALVGLVLLECFQPLRDPVRPSDEWVAGLSTGAAAALAISLKATYFMVAALLIASSLLVRGKMPGIRRLAAMAAGFGVLIFAALAYLRFNLHQVIEGYRIAAGARSATLSMMVPIWTIESNLGLLFVALAVGLTGAFLKSRSRSWLGQIELPVVAVIIYLADIGLLMGNTQYFALPLLPVFALLVASRFAEERKSTAGTRTRKSVTVSRRIALAVRLACSAAICFRHCGTAGRRGPKGKCFPNEPLAVRWSQPSFEFDFLRSPGRDPGKQRQHLCKIFQ